MSHSDSASRVVAAAADTVYAAFVDPEALLRWLPPAGMSGRFEHFDARPGGSYRMVLTYGGDSPAAGKTTADSDAVSVRYIDIVPGERVVQAVDFDSDDPAFSGTMLMMWQATAVAGGTRVDIRADDVPDGISSEDHAIGPASSLANLAAYVEN
ncbi:SRPBCC domain-containing protein [Pengzhenrongella sp.]|uniref:SRPBCC domain-containing protein n=1 Tax=Pengzhenrongella sp. TaxID=2888820 RepID=UPI002F9297F1